MTIVTKFFMVVAVVGALWAASTVHTVLTNAFANLPF